MDKKRFALCIIAVVLAITAIVIEKCIFRPEGYMRVTVLDGFSNAPIKGARVYIPELNLTAYTDDSGKTDILKIPIKKEAHYEVLLEQDYGITTVLVYKDGYTPYGLFYAHVIAGELRKGPNIYLFPYENGSSPFIVIESPDEEWAEKLIIDKEGCS
ncbi:MAG: hypothetical protein RRY79_01915 [Clostridia bacterium]